MRGFLTYLVGMLAGILALGPVLLFGAAAVGSRKGGLRRVGKLWAVGLLVYGICVTAFMDVLILILGYLGRSN